jgi:hypothetical protein
MWTRFADHVEARLGDGGMLDPVRGLAKARRAHSRGADARKQYRDRRGIGSRALVGAEIKLARFWKFTGHCSAQISSCR